MDQEKVNTEPHLSYPMFSLCNADITEPAFGLIFNFKIRADIENVFRLHISPISNLLWF